MHSTRTGVIAIVLGAGLAACNPTSDADLTKAAQCVDIPDGQFFQFINGKLVAVSSLDEPVGEQPILTAQRVGRSLAGQGFPWLTVAWDGQTATIGGLAPSEASRIDGFRNARDAFEKDPMVGDMVQRVVNNIELRFQNTEVSSTLEDAFAAMRISWLEADVKNQVVVLHGMAPDEATKQDAYRAAMNAISIQLNDDDTEYVAVDAISVAGQQEPVGEALLTLGDAPSLIECDNAFFETMDDQSIAFVEGEAIVANSSKPLMDALAGVASLCRDYEIEIRQHASGPSDEMDVLELSQNRASAIRDQLSIFADRDSIEARGFGAQNPVDTSDTAEARARNQRTVFIVREREN
ncbi:MAG: OmpA family protein [Hyphomonas sp.]|nr:OmpA family protein [Hyphomonas sp.]